MSSLSPSTNLPGDIKDCALLFPSSSSVNLHCKVLDKLPFISSRIPLYLDVKDTVLGLGLLPDSRWLRFHQLALYVFPSIDGISGVVTKPFFVGFLFKTKGSGASIVVDPNNIPPAIINRGICPLLFSAVREYWRHRSPLQRRQTCCVVLQRTVAFDWSFSINFAKSKRLWHFAVWHTRCNYSLTMTVTS